MSSTDERPVDEWGDLAAQLDEEYPRSWRPRWKGKKDKPLKPAEVDADEIIGTVIRTDWNSVEWNETRRMIPVLILATHPTGELRSVWCIHSVLAQDVTEQRIPDGARVAIRYEGKVPPKDGGNPYHSYKLAVRRPGPGSVPVTVANREAPPAPPNFGDEAPF